MKDQPEFPALALLASRGLLAPDAWKCKRAQVSLKATIDVPMLGTIIEQNGDGLEDSHMPVGWPLHIDGAVRQCCIHLSATLQELDDMLREYDMKRDSVEINHNAPQWSHNAVWNRKYMEPKTGNTLRQLWADSEPAIGQKSSPSYEVKDGDIRRAVAAIADLPSSTLPDSPFILALGTPVADAKALVDDPAAFTREMTKILLEKQNHPLIAQMIQPAGSSDPPPSNSAASSTGSHEHPSAYARAVPVSQTVNVGYPRLPLCNTGAVTKRYPWLTSA